jgi:hypothetical protein
MNMDVRQFAIENGMDPQEADMFASDPEVSALVRRNYGAQQPMQLAVTPQQRFGPLKQARAAAAAAATKQAMRQPVQQPNTASTISEPTQQPGPNYQSEYERLQKEREVAARAQEESFAPPDYSGMEKLAGQRKEGASKALLMALAAREADMGDISKHYQGRAAGLGDELKTAGGIVSQGGFTQDPDYGSQRRQQLAQTRLNQIDAAIGRTTNNIERAELEREKITARRELAQERAALSIALANSRRGPAAGPAEPKPVSPGKTLPTKVVMDLTDGQAKASAIARLGQEFDPSYSGVAGMASQAAGQYIPGVDTRAAEWWRNYRKEQELIERHGLFGATLTGNELSAWRAADIQPKMSPDAIQRNLARRAEIIQAHQDKVLNNLGKSGYNITAFGDAEAPAAPAQQAPAQQAPAQQAPAPSNAGGLSAAEQAELAALKAKHGRK